MLSHDLPSCPPEVTEPPSSDSEPTSPKTAQKRSVSFLASNHEIGESSKQNAKPQSVILFIFPLQYHDINLFSQQKPTSTTAHSLPLPPIPTQPRHLQHNQLLAHHPRRHPHESLLHVPRPPPQRLSSRNPPQLNLRHQLNPLLGIRLFAIPLPVMRRDPQTQTYIPRAKFQVHATVVPA